MTEALIITFIAAVCWVVPVWLLTGFHYTDWQWWGLLAGTMAFHIGLTLAAWVKGRNR